MNWRKFDGFQFLSSNNRWFIGMSIGSATQTYKDNRYLVFLFLIHSSSWLPKNYISWVSWIVKKKKSFKFFFLLLSGTRTEIVCFFFEGQMSKSLSLGNIEQNEPFCCVCACTKFHSDFFLFAYYLSMWLNDDDTPTIFFSFFLNEWVNEWLNEIKKRKEASRRRQNNKNNLTMKMLRKERNNHYF